MEETTIKEVREITITESMFNEMINIGFKANEQSARLDNIVKYVAQTARSQQAVDPAIVLLLAGVQLNTPQQTTGGEVDGKEEK